MDLIPTALAIIMGVTEALKRGFKIPTRFIPLIAILLGILYTGFVVEWSAFSVTQGLMIGLMSVGLYRTVQKVVE